MSNKKQQLLSFEGPILHGTISTATGKCGQKACPCQKDRKAWHGPYYRWTGRLDGKLTTKTLSKEMAQECERRIKNYRKLKQKIRDLLNLATDSAPWNATDNK